MSISSTDRQTSAGNTLEMEETSQLFGHSRKVLWSISLATCVATGLLGMIVIFGWHTGNHTLVQVLPTFVPMQYNTALGFVLCGVALGSLAFRRKRASAIAGGLMTLLGLLTLIEYIGNVNLHIDELFMKHDITVGTSQPGRMAPNSAICFVLTGLWAILPAIRRFDSRRSVAMVILASLTLGLAVVALSGYFTHLETAYGWGNLTRMAVHTSAGFITISIGVLCLMWAREIRQASWMPHWLPVPIAVAIVTATLCLWLALVAASERLQRQYEELSSLSNVATLMLLGGLMLAFAMARSAYLAQKASRRAADVARTNRALKEEVRTRKLAEAALESHRENLELLVAERTRECAQACREAEAANRSKSDFLSHMSHELRTPLNGILGYAQILQRDSTLSEGQRTNLQAIINCGDHLLALINDVLDLSKIEAGRLEVDLAPLDLPKLLQGVSDIVRSKASSKDIGFDVQLSTVLPPAIVSDAAKLRQILVNLLGNAVKFTETGGVTLRVAEQPHGTLRLDVEDTGVGMAPEELNEIFDPFKQVEAGKAAGGTGLGLAITQRLVHAMDGTISVHSEKGTGSVFSVQLPLVEAHANALEEIPDSKRASFRQAALAEGHHATILIADDRDTNRDVLNGMLKAVGFTTLLASDGDEALDRLREHSEVDLVLMDVRMPRVDGLEALKQIRADESLNALKVIAVTASVFPEFRERAVDAGFDDFLAKPFRVEELMQKLNKHLDVQFVEQTEADVGDTTLVVESLGNGPAAIPPALLNRLRDALRLKNLTAIKAVAAELSSHPETAALGEKIGALVRAFDFPGLADLTKDLEQDHGNH